MHVNRLHSKQGNRPESRLFYFHGKGQLVFDSYPQPPFFKAVALPTEPPSQGSNHTSYAVSSRGFRTGLFDAEE